ncbi:hypothetical protein C6502_01705 [Candidatus Poribacteria bacterium]|nr:MAG: hypothetical protein C6502_01705 [Candidatus Poribacteria bacterium]
MRIYTLVFCFWAATGPLHAKIVFTSFRDGNWEIYKMDSDGGNQTRLTHNKVADTAPVWSPNGRQIVFERDEGKGEIYLMDADGSNQRNLTNHPAMDTAPHWHPNGTRIIFFSGRGASSRIYVMDTAGGNVEEIPGLLRASGPKWSPDGKWIAFEGVAEESDVIQIVNPDANQLRVISVPIPRPMSVAGWSPDGRRIMYFAAFDDAGDDAILVIVTLSRDGSGKAVGWQRVRPPRSIDGSPAWGADGKSILFLGRNHGNENIYRYRLDNRQLIRLTDHPDSDGAPNEWHPLLTVSPQGLVPILWGGIKSNYSNRSLPLLTLPR